MFSENIFLLGNRAKEKKLGMPRQAYDLFTILVCYSFYCKTSV